MNINNLNINAFWLAFGLTSFSLEIYLLFYSRLLLSFSFSRVCKTFSCPLNDYVKICQPLFFCSLYLQFFLFFGPTFIAMLETSIVSPNYINTSSWHKNKNKKKQKSGDNYRTHAKVVWNCFAWSIALWLAPNLPQMTLRQRPHFASSVLLSPLWPKYRTMPTSSFCRKYYYD